MKEIQRTIEILRNPGAYPAVMVSRALADIKTMSYTCNRCEKGFDEEATAETVH